MKKKNIFILIILFTFCQLRINAQQENCCTSKLTKKGFAHYSPKKLGKEYSLLKKMDHKCCDKYQSDLHKIMQVLSEKLNKPGKDTSSVIRIMGTPDAHSVPPQYGKFISGNENIMIYCWRGWQDFLYIISENGKIKYAKWFYSLE